MLIGLAFVLVSCLGQLYWSFVLTISSAIIVSSRTTAPILGRALANDRSNDRSNKISTLSGTSSYAILSSAW
jgi:hypothetical protein